MSEPPAAGSLDRRYGKNPGLVTRRIAEETMLVPVKGKLAQLQKIFVLNPVAAHVWERLDGESPLRDVLSSITAEFDVSEDEARCDLLELVDTLLAADLIRDVDAPGAGR